ncbi:MAG: hypothetical protein ACQEQO_10265 [Thermodesulfobacteriota bacterium]
MADTIFLQFYNKTKGGYFDLCNGFSDTYDLCKSKGDFFWTEHEIDREKWFIEETYTKSKLPISKGKVYISAIYTNHLYQSYVWAQEYPHIQFVIGGPVAAERRIDSKGWNPLYFNIKSPRMLPPNLKITGKSVEDWFGVSNFSGKWRLDVPEFVPDDGKIYFSYTLDNGCYWSKCIFCNIALHAKELFRKRKHMDFEFQDLTHKGTKIVRLNTGSITIPYIREVMPALPCRDDMEYRLFMRPAKAENKALQEALNTQSGEFPHCVLGFGIEFPANRMLRYIDKGCTTAEILEFLSLCKENRIRVNANLILGWDNLIEDDIRELNHFMERIPKKSITTVQLRWLFAHPHTKVHDMYRGERITLGPFYEGFHVEISKKQKELNQEAAEIISRYRRIKHYKLEGMVNIRKNLEKD